MSRKARPFWEPLLVLALLPAAVHGFLLFIMVTEAENSWEILAVTILAAGGVGLFGGQRGYGAVITCLSAAWLPAFMTWKRTYWAMGGPSPGGSAKSLLLWTTGIDAHSLHYSRTS